MTPSGVDRPATTLVRRAGVLGELVLREAPDGHHEVVSNGVFLMDTRDGRSERALVDLAVAAAPGERLHVVVAGLGVGFSVGAALASPRVAAVTVVEIEPAVVDLVRDVTGRRTGADLHDPRVEVVLGDVRDVLAGGALRPADVCCLDVDNGPAWTVADSNTRLYGDAGLRLLARGLVGRGVLGVWGAQDDSDFSARLVRRFARVTTHAFPVARGEPDVVWVATGPRQASLTGG